jgi:hypothetical protein
MFPSTELGVAPSTDIRVGCFELTRRHMEFGVKFTGGLLRRTPPPDAALASEWDYRGEGSDRDDSVVSSGIRPCDSAYVRRRDPESRDSPENGTLGPDFSPFGRFLRGREGRLPPP